MTVQVCTKSRFGFSAAFVTVVTVGGVEVIRRIELLRRNIVFICIAFGVVGLLAWLKGRLTRLKHKHPESSPAVGSDGEEDSLGPLGFLRRHEYWGMMLCLIALLLFVLTAYTMPRSEPRPAPPQPLPRPVLPPGSVEKPKRKLPPLELKALIYNGSNSTAFINGHVLRLGERIQGVQVIAIDRERVLVELDGQTNTLRLPP